MEEVPTISPSLIHLSSQDQEVGGSPEGYSGGMSGLSGRFDETPERPFVSPLTQMELPAQPLLAQQLFLQDSFGTGADVVDSLDFAATPLEHEGFPPSMNQATSQ